LYSRDRYFISTFIIYRTASHPKLDEHDGVGDYIIFVKNATLNTSQVIPVVCHINQFFGFFSWQHIILNLFNANSTVLNYCIIKSTTKIFLKKKQKQGQLFREDPPIIN